MGVYACIDGLLPLMLVTGSGSSRAVRADRALRASNDHPNCVVGSYRGLVKGVARGDPPGITRGRPFIPGKPPGFHPPDLRIR